MHTERWEGCSITKVIGILLAAIATGLFVLATGLLVWRMWQSRRDTACWQCDALPMSGGALGVVPKGRNLPLFGKIALVAVGSRLLMLVLGWALFGDHSHDFLTSLYNVWAKSDAPHYIDLANDWYVNTGEARLFIVFFPLYPALVRGLNLIVGNTFLSSLLVSACAFAGACFYLYKYLALDMDAAGCRRGLKYLLLFPVSFFFAGTYTESLFLLLLMAALYAARRGKTLVACLLGMGLALTRSLGVIVALPILMELLRTKDFAKIARQKGYAAAFKALFPQLAALLLVPAGTGLYLLLNKLVTGNWLQFLVHQREHWSQQMGSLWNTVTVMIAQFDRAEPSLILYLWIPQLICLFGVLALLVYAARKQRASDQAYSLAYYFFAIAPTWLLSCPRYLMVLPGVYIALARLGEKKWVDWLITLALAAGLAFMYQGFLRGQHIY